jgi:hypothetical protein
MAVEHIGLLPEAMENQIFRPHLFNRLKKWSIKEASQTNSKRTHHNHLVYGINKIVNTITDPE